MAYKKLTDGFRPQALAPFLKAANVLQGLSLTVAVDRSIQFVTPEQIAEIYGARPCPWNSKVYNRVLCIAHLVSLLVSGLSSPGQDLAWTTDRDEIADSRERMEGLTRTLLHVSPPYIPHKMGRLLCEDNQCDEGAIRSDYLAIADLVAGTFCDMLLENQVSTRTVGAREKSLLEMRKVPEKAHQILRWHMEKHHPLQRLFCIIDRTSEPGKFQITWPEYGGGK